MPFSAGSITHREACRVARGGDRLRRSDDGLQRHSGRRGNRCIPRRSWLTSAPASSSAFSLPNLAAGAAGNQFDRPASEIAGSRPVRKPGRASRPDPEKEPPRACLNPAPGERKTLQGAVGGRATTGPPPIFRRGNLSAIEICADIALLVLYAHRCPKLFAKGTPMKLRSIATVLAIALASAAAYAQSGVYVTFDAQRFTRTGIYANPGLMATSTVHFSLGPAMAFTMTLLICPGSASSTPAHRRRHRRPRRRLPRQHLRVSD